MTEKYDRFFWIRLVTFTLFGVLFCYNETVLTTKTILAGCLCLQLLRVQYIHVRYRTRTNLFLTRSSSCRETICKPT